MRRHFLSIRFYISISLFIYVLSVTAQQTVLVNLPDIYIMADKITRGDSDTYGLGDWSCSFKLELEGAVLKVDGSIIFSEKANDFTTIVGEYHEEIPVKELEKCRSCSFSLEDSYGIVSGPNIGARGYRWYPGQGLIRRAKIITDTFGADAGRIGGTIQFEPVRVIVRCMYAGL